ncbi:hypothetical protein FKM82_012762 [Ascaphus truei]
MYLHVPMFCMNVFVDIMHQPVPEAAGPLPEEEEAVTLFLTEVTLEEVPAAALTAPPAAPAFQAAPAAPKHTRSAPLPEDTLMSHQVELIER